MAEEEEGQTTEPSQTPDESASREDQGNTDESLIYEAQKARDDELETK